VETVVWAIDGVGYTIRLFSRITVNRQLTPGFCVVNNSVGILQYGCNSKLGQFR
jgi:hypothetical protein